jgi:hypothetical protein
VFGWIQLEESISRDDISGDVISQEVNPEVDFSRVDFPPKNTPFFLHLSYD